MSNLKKCVIAIALIVCCIAGFKLLYDKFLMPRFVLASLLLSALFLFSILFRKKLRIPKSSPFYFYSVFVVLTGLSIFWSINLGEAVFQFCQYLMGLMVCVMVFGFLTKDYQATKKVLWICSGVVLVVYLLFAIIQLFNINNTSLIQLYAVTGINAHKNLLSVMLFVLSSFFLTAFPEIKNKFLKTFVIVVFGISIITILFLKSRAVILGLVISILVFSILYCLHSRNRIVSKRLETTVTIFGVFLSFLILLLFFRYLVPSSATVTYDKSEAQIGITSTFSLKERFVIWDKTYQMVENKPFFGHGVGNWQISFPSVGLKGLNRADYWNVNFTKPHNEYIGVLAENGHFGLLLLLAFIVSLVVSSGISIIETKDRKEFVFGAILLSVVCGCCINAFFDFPNSRVEHLIWINIHYAILLFFIARKTVNKKYICVGKPWNLILLFFAVLIVIDGVIRFKGERETVAMQQAMRHEDWNSMAHYSSKAFSPLYSVDPIGIPLFWYHGQSLKAMGDRRSIYSFRQAYNAVPFCKENLNDLGVDEYYIAGDRERAVLLLNEDIRIFPHYLYPYFNLVGIYVTEGEFHKAKEVLDSIDFDEQKRDFLKEEAHYFRPYDTEHEKQKIDADFETVVMLRQMIDSITRQTNEK